MLEIKQFINYINGYLDDDYREYIDFVGAEYYFTHCGCYEFAKIIKHFIPTTKLFRSNPNSSIYNDYIIVKINDFYYDAKGEISKELAESEFSVIRDEDEKNLAEYIGNFEVNIEGEQIDELIIKETETVIAESPNGNIGKIINTINAQVTNVTSNKILKKSKSEKLQ